MAASPHQRTRAAEKRVGWHVGRTPLRPSAIAAENGATDRQLMALFDWTSEKQANTYTAAADRKRLAADAARLIARIKQ